MWDSETAFILTEKEKLTAEEEKQKQRERESKLVMSCRKKGKLNQYLYLPFPKLCKKLLIWMIISFQFHSQTHHYSFPFFVSFFFFVAFLKVKNGFKREKKRPDLLLLSPHINCTHHTPQDKKSFLSYFILY